MLPYGAATAIGALILWPIVDELVGAPDAAERLGALLLRLGTVLIAAAALDTYTALVRSDDRELLGLLPVDSGQVAWAALGRVAVGRLWLVPAGLVLLWPLTHRAPETWVAAGVFLLGTWWLGVVASGIAHLGAVSVAESPAWAPVLDLLRGSNLRAQAAFLYAPGATLAATGFLVALAGDSVARGSPLVLLPGVVGMLLVPAIAPMARKTWFRATVVLSEIDGRYAAVEGAADVSNVAFDWLVPWLPELWRPWALRDLRHGWRARRTWVSGAWLLGFAALALGWSAAPAGPKAATAGAVSAVLVLAAVVIRLAMDEPPFLRVWLPPGGLSSRLARAVVVAAWLQPAVWVPALGTLLRSGSLAIGVVVVGEIAVVVAVFVASVAAIWPERGMWAYGPLAVVGLAAAWGLS